MDENESECKARVAYCYAEECACCETRFVSIASRLFQNYRELDRGTNYFRAHVLNLWDKYSNNNVNHQDWIEIVLWASVSYRLVNRISTFEEFGGIPEVSDWPRFREFMKKTAAIKPVFTDAHITSGMKPFLKSMSSLYEKDARTMKRVSRKVLERCQNRDLKGCCDAVKTIRGAGTFISWQVICDLMESQCLKPCTENDWTELGPGAQGGIRIIFRDGNCQNYTDLDLAALLHKIQDDVFRALGLNFPRFHGAALTLKNIEHPLCEFKKYNDIHGNLSKNRRTTGQRLVRSRGAMDCDKACRNVEKCGETEEILFCDKCLVGFCESCAPRDSSSDYWVCPRCTSFEAILFG